MVQGSNSNITNVYQNHLLSILTSRTLVGNQGNYSSYDGDLEKEVHDRDYPDHVIEAVYEKLEDPNLELELVNALNLRAIIEVLQKDRSRVIVESARELITHIEPELRDEHDMEIGDTRSSRTSFSFNLSRNGGFFNFCKLTLNILLSE